jgi:hypothetical protein
MTIQMGNGPVQPATLKPIPGTGSWAVDFGGAFLFPERAPRLRLRAQGATDWEVEILKRFPSVRISPLDLGHPPCCVEQRETA